MTDYTYIGSELDVFALATNWKAYYRKHIESYIGGEVLEVGAGIGATTLTLNRGGHTRWLCLEPDPALASQTSRLVESGELPAGCEVRVGTVGELEAHEETFDTVLYIDVLEHIEADREEVAAAAMRLSVGGHLVVLAPAHPGLYTPFDAMIGHHRRYTKESLAAVVPATLKRCELFYLDSVGAIASASNRYILKSGTPTRQQILFWDRVMIPLSKLFDPLFRYRVGKSVVGVWQRTGDDIS